MTVQPALTHRPILMFLTSFFLAMAITIQPVMAAKRGKSTLVLHVDDDAKPNGNGTGAKPFKSVSDAVDSARDRVADYHKVTIAVRPGTYAIPETLLIDFPLAIHGANAPGIDSDGWPTGSVQSNTETVLVAQSCAGPLILVGGAGVDVVNNVTIRNLSLAGKPGGCTAQQSLFLVQRAQNVTVADNIVTGPGFSGIEPVVSSGLIARNYVSGMDACGICIGAGTEEIPTQLTITDNRSVGNAGGLLLAGTTYPVIEDGNVLDVSVLHNDLSGNVLNTALGFGVRIFAIGPELPASQYQGNVTARFYDNRIADNRNGVMIDAGFPRRNLVPSGCDDRDFTAGFDLTFRGNTITGSLARTALISFTRGQVITGGNPLLRWQYLHNSTFAIDDPDLSLMPYVLDHPEEDPFTGGTCSKDATNEPLLNTLFYNGIEVPENY